MSVGYTPSSATYARSQSVIISGTGLASDSGGCRIDIVDSATGGFVVNLTVGNGEIDGGELLVPQVCVIPESTPYATNLVFRITNIDEQNNDGAVFTIPVPALVSPTPTFGTPTTNSVEVSWGTATGGVEPYNYQLQMSLTGVGDWVSLDDAQSSPVEVTGLDPDTTYYFRVVTEDSQPVSDNSDVASVTTAAEPPTPGSNDFCAGLPMLHLCCGGGNVI